MAASPGQPNAAIEAQGEEAAVPDVVQPRCL